MLLRERVMQEGGSLRLDKTAGVVRGVKLLGLKSANNRRYTPEAVRKAVGLYAGVKVYLNHPDRPGQSRRAEDVVGRIINPRVGKCGGLYGDMEYLRSHPMAGRIEEAAEGGRSWAFGFSHVANGVEQRGRLSADREMVIEEITSVSSCDIVAEAATVSSLFEAIGPVPVGSSVGAWLTESDVRHHSLAEAIRDQQRLAVFARTHVRRLCEVADATLQDPDRPEYATGGSSDEALMAAAKAVIGDRTLTIAEKLAKVRKILKLAKADRPAEDDGPPDELNVTEPTSGIMTKESRQRARRLGRWLTS